MTGPRVAAAERANGLTWTCGGCGRSGIRQTTGGRLRRHHLPGQGSRLIGDREFCPNQSPHADGTRRDRRAG